MQLIQPCGPYNLCGYSFGTSVAIEMAIQLQTQDAGLVAALCLLDGSHRFVSSHTGMYRDQLTIRGQVEEQTAALCAFVQQFMATDMAKV